VSGSVIRKIAPLPGRRFGRDASAMRASDGRDDREPEADAAARAVSDAYAALDSAGRTTVPGSVASAQTKAEAAIADAVAKLRGGRYLEAATAARGAVTAAGRVLRAAVKATRP